MPDAVTKREAQRAESDAKWWKENIAGPLGIQLYGYSYRQTASFMKDGHSIQLPRWFADVIIETLKKESK